MARPLELVNSYSINEVPSSLQNRYEYNGDGTVAYAGHAPRGAESTDNSWTIFQYTYVGGAVTLKQTGYGAWSDRASLEYL